MIRLAFYILVLLVVSVIRTAQNSYLDSIPGVGGWISSSLNSKTKPVEVESDEVPNEEPRHIVAASNGNNDIKVVINHEDDEEPIPVDNLLDQLNDEVKINDDQHKSELVRISQQLGRALYDNSIGKVDVLMKGVWHVVDLGLAGSSQRKRSAKKAEGIMKIMNIFLSGLSGVGKLLCGLFASDDSIQSFDAREAWSNCQNIISSIRDQGQVGSAWAVAAASVLSDRLCIASEAAYNKPLSSEDLMRCCRLCVMLDKDVVVGGYMYQAIDYLKVHGIVSGGEYGSKEGCLPYSYLPHNHLEYGRQLEKNAECDRKCSNTNHNTSYQEDKIYSINGYTRYKLPEQTAALKKDLKTKGSCIAMMTEYEDFRTGYKRGIYAYDGISTRPRDHFIRLIGWGKENEKDYWLVANSRGKDWGEEGIGKIGIIDNGCDFGQSVWCIKPKKPVPVVTPNTILP